MKSSHFIALCVADISSDLAICILVFHFRAKFVDLMPSGFFFYLFFLGFYLFIWKRETENDQGRSRGKADTVQGAQHVA